jgi:hypothetical protein
MEIVYYGNIIEGIFWIGVSLIFFLSACKRHEPHRLFCIYGGIIFWYIKINGSWAATRAKLKQPVFRRKPPKQEEGTEQDN